MKVRDRPPLAAYHPDWRQRLKALPSAMSSLRDKIIRPALFLGFMACFKRFSASATHGRIRDQHLTWGGSQTRPCQSNDGRRRAASVKKWPLGFRLNQFKRLLLPEQPVGILVGVVIAPGRSQPDRSGATDRRSLRMGVMIRPKFQSPRSLWLERRSRRR
jgi:hypothetical protein